MKNKKNSNTKMKENRWNSCSLEGDLYFFFFTIHIINKKAANIINYHYVTSSFG